jgi:riboflavin synthase
MANTTLMDKHPGAIVNLETDVIGKYVHSFTVGHPSQASSGLTMEKLLENGF